MSKYFFLNSLCCSAHAHIAEKYGRTARSRQDTPSPTQANKTNTHTRHMHVECVGNDCIQLLWIH